MKEIIKNYLEEQCKVDPCLAEKYKDTLIGGCRRYRRKGKGRKSSEAGRENVGFV